MKKFIAAAALAVTTSAPLVALAPAAHADAGSPGCVTKAEYRKVKKGMTPTQVKNRFGTNGKITSTFNFDGYRSLTREYKACGSKYGSVMVSFDADPRKPLRLSYKFGMWI